eukprot:4494686-Prymnesium_polylepis.1
MVPAALRPPPAPATITLTILTPPESGDVHVSFQGAELESDYLCVTHFSSTCGRIFRIFVNLRTQIAFFVNRPGKAPP